MILIFVRRVLATAALAAALVAAGCADDGGGSGGDGPQVVATTGFAADIASAVAGDDAEVQQLVPDSASPHSYSASAKDRRRLAEADLVVAIGQEYEAGLPLGDAPRLEIAEEVGKLREFAEGGADPHVWMDPTRSAQALPALADALAEADPPNADAYRTRARKYAVALHELDAEIRAILDRVPDDDRKLVTSHDSLGYFADRYDLAFVGAPFGASPEAEASASAIADLVTKVRAQRVPAVFSQNGDDPKVMERIAEEADVEVVDDLLIENPGSQGPTYERALLHDARRIAEALGP